MRWNAVVGIVFLLVGVVAALLLALTRWQAVQLLAPTWFYRILTLHGLNMLIFFIIFFEMAILYFAGPIVLGCAATGAQARLDRLRSHARRRPAGRRHRAHGPGGRALHLLRAAQGASALLPGHHPLRGRRAHRHAPLLRRARRGQTRKELHRLDAAGLLRRAHRGDHRGDHASPRRGDLHPDLPLVAWVHERRPGGLPPDVLGARARLAADQRRRHGLGLVSAWAP